MDEELDVAVIGAGFSGLGMGHALQAEGRRSFAILEKADEVGGTWRENTYPGCACDVPSHLYSFSFAPNPDWSRMYAQQPEIQNYLTGFATRSGLRARTRFGWKLAEARWDETARRWRLTSSDGRRVAARVVAAGMGGLHIPAFPEIPGLESFAGPVFHSAQWRGDVDLAGKRVGVIGTGASAIQLVPQVAGSAGELVLFQRTPPWILPKLDREMSGVEKALFAAIPAVQEVYRRAIYLRNEWNGLGFLDPKLMAAAEKLAREHLERAVVDPVLRARLTPDYTIGCKRILIANDYYPALQRPSVRLVTDRVTDAGVAGVTAGGQAHALDVLVLATGFKPMEVASGVTITGEGGRKLADDWAPVPRTHLGISTPGYPNLFFLMGPNTGLGHNSMVYMIESQVAHVMEALRLMDRANASAVALRPQAADAFSAELDEKLTRTVWSSGCRSWYVTPDGRNATIWPDLTFRYRRRARSADEDIYQLIA